jgi:nitrate reductase beta subunit
MVFHLDKCIGCHTCSVACKNIWTDRQGAEYMWWNNVETKPGTGYPTAWEDQERYRGGWSLSKDRKLALSSQSRASALLKLFYNPNQPNLDDYYEPWTYQYGHLFNAPAGDDQPTARPVSLVTGELMDTIEAGPNWDDDLSGSPVYAENDPNLSELSPEEREILFSIERISMMYLPRICNHCLNPACVAACPSGAIYKRGEDGIVLINQEVCKGWRACVAACPYKKTYFNWSTGKSEKCILCYPRLETGQAPACFHSCVGRIRYMGVLLYDADRIESVAKSPASALAEAQRSIILDPFDPKVIEAAKAKGISPELIEAAQNSPVYKYVVLYKLALPLHPEFRTVPMLYYVPPLLPILGRTENGNYNHDDTAPFASIEQARIPVRYLAKLFAAGNTKVVEDALKRLIAVRTFKRAQMGDEIAQDVVDRVMHEADLTPALAEEIYALTALASDRERFNLPPLQREEAIEGGGTAAEHAKGLVGLGLHAPPKRGP